MIEKTMKIYQNNLSFEQIYSFKTFFTMEKLWYYGKTMVLWKNYGTMPKNMEL